MYRKIVAVWVSLTMMLGLIVIVDVIMDFTLNVGGTTLYVNTTGSDGAFTKIQDAINVANNGDTVFVYNGTYYENVVVNKTINLIGETRDSTIIDGSGYGVHITVDFVSISGFSITDSGIGILVNSNYNIISDNNISDNINYGIHIELSTGNHISNNILSTNTRYSMFLEKSYDNVVENNVVDDGIVIYGYYLEHWNTHSINTSNIVKGKPVYYWKNQTGGIVPANAGQVILANCTNVKVVNQKLTNGSVGIELGFSSENNVTANTALNIYDGIRLYYSHNNTITGNNFSNNWRGIYIRYSDSNKIAENIASGNDAIGIVLDRFSSRNEIKDNTVSSNNKGITIVGPMSGWNNITGNYPSNNNYGIDLHDTSNNRIYHNNIIANANQAYDNRDDNYWDNGYPSGGNFWSDYTGIDQFSGPNQNLPGNDGIGDTNYSIDGDSWDNYPLMTPIGNCTFLYDGWNLVSIPFIQSDTNLGPVLSSITGSYDAVQWYNVSDNYDNWKHNHKSKPSSLNDLDSIDYNMGFWIHITEPGGVLYEYSGTQPTSNQTINLHPGWNMVGYPSQTSYNRTVGLNNLTFDTQVDAIWTYNPTTQKYKQLTESDYFEIGKGYYIHAKEECTWVVPL
jgi:parallel beta-helix repeat protein